MIMNNLFDKVSNSYINVEKKWLIIESDNTLYRLMNTVCPQKGLMIALCPFTNDDDEILVKITDDFTEQTLVYYGLKQYIIEIIMMNVINKH